jgi:thioredoxin 1
MIALMSFQRRHLMSEFVSEVTSADFEKVVLGSDLPVLVDFWAPWCGPCRMVAPEFEKLAQSHGSTARFCKLNVDEAGDIAARYGVMSIPTIGKFEKGELVAQVVGARGAEALAREFGLA